MMTKDEARYGVRVYWQTRGVPEVITSLTPLELYADIKEKRPELLQYERPRGADPYMDIKAWIWEFVEPHL
jgi:hypothetical protein